MSLGYSVFVFTDEGDCMVTEILVVSSWSASVSRTIKISTWSTSLLKSLNLFSLYCAE